MSNLTRFCCFWNSCVWFSGLKKSQIYLLIGYIVIICANHWRFVFQIDIGMIISENILTDVSVQHDDSIDTYRLISVSIVYRSWLYRPSHSLIIYWTPSYRWIVFLFSHDNIRVIDKMFLNWCVRLSYFEKIIKNVFTHWT